MKNSPKSNNGFDIAVLTPQVSDQALQHQPATLSIEQQKARLFLISKRNNNENGAVSDKKQQAPQYEARRRVNRKAVTFKESFNFMGETYCVNPKKSGLYVEILKSMIKQFQIAEAKWKRVFVLRFDLHMSVSRRDSKIVTAFRKRLFQKLKLYYGFTDICYCWVREQERAKSQHYHWALFLDGNLIRHSSRINKVIKQTWEMPCGSYHVPVIKHPFYFVDNKETTQLAIKRISYLAKTRGKGYRDEQAKDFQCSRMKLVENLYRGG